MNKKLLSISLLSSALLLSGCGNIVRHEVAKSPIEILENDTKNANLVPNTDGMLFEANKAPAKEKTFPDKIRFHYHNDDGKWDKTLWMWTPSAAPGKDFFFNEKKEEDGWSILLEFDPFEVFGTRDKSFSFIVKDPGADNWAQKSNEIVVNYKDFKFTYQEDKAVLDLYVSQFGRKVNVYPSKEQALADRIDVAFIGTSYDKINIYTRDGTGNGESKLKDIRIYKFNEHYLSLSPEQRKLHKTDYQIFFKYDVNKETFAVKFDHKLPVNSQYFIEATFVDKPELVMDYTISMDNLYNTDEFNTLNYDGDDLGARVSKDKKSTTFKVWAPTANKMTLKVFERGYDSKMLPLEKYNDKNEISKCDNYKRYSMKLNLETAVWEVTVPENLDGKYYMYTVYNSVGTNDVVDPYAYSAGVKGRRSMVVDFDNPRAIPENWDTLPLKWDGTERDIKTPQELAVSEVHIRDLTMHESWNGPDKLKGTFKGFIESGTKVEGTNVATGYDHLVDYGVNAIQLLPVFDFDNNERKVEFVKGVNPKAPEEKVQITKYDELAEFNWGYNPLNYNAVEGAYSSDPRDGYARIKEFRELIYKFANNENKTRIIMDVVYNHVSSAPTSCFELLMPMYYFRFEADGGYSDASGCGNEVKTEAPMMSKFIVDSLVHWATHYKVKGFRFDLMGCIDTNTLAKAADALYEVDPDIVMYGEGWAGFIKPNIPDSIQAMTGNLKAKLGPNRAGHHGFVGGFNDGGRDGVKGKHDNPDNNDWGGFILGNKGNDFFHPFDATKGLVLGVNQYASNNNSPLQNVAYASAHDNYTLFDHLNWGLSDKKNEPDIHLPAHASAGVNAMVLMSNCISFIHGGEEIFRQKIVDTPKEELNAQDLKDEVEMFGKRISHNSYKCSDFTNAYNYDRKVTCLEEYNLYKQLVSIKKRLAYSSEDVDGNRTHSGDAIAIMDNNTGSNKLCFKRKTTDGKTLYVCLATDDMVTFNVPGKVIFKSSAVTDKNGGREISYRSVMITEE